MNKNRSKLFFFWIVLTVSIFGCCGFLIKKEYKNLKRQNRVVRDYFKSVKDGVDEGLPVLGYLTKPFLLQNVPMGEDHDVVVDVQNISIDDIEAPYNASIVEKDDKSGYLLFFRHDVLNKKSFYGYFTNIAYVELDADFNPVGKSQNVDVGSFYAEDPRVLNVGKDVYLVYNDVIGNLPYLRNMHIGKVDFSENKVEKPVRLETNLQPIEKNWSPFEYVEKGESKVCFEYFINPHKILKMNDLQDNKLEHLMLPSEQIYQKNLWSAKWGGIKGGTPALKIGDEYLAFFHSFFLDKHKFAWYVMGAYTFEAKSPFRITAISNYPILFNGIYDSEPKKSASLDKRVIFPSGVVLGQKDGREVLHVSCGENDSAVKIVTIDKENLLKSLRKIK